MADANPDETTPQGDTTQSPAETTPTDTSPAPEPTPEPTPAPEPEPTPTSEPAPAPEEKTEDKPAEKPTEEPAEKPEDKPQDGAAVTDAPSPMAPAPTADSVGLTPEQHAHDTTPEQQGVGQDPTLAGALDLLADQVARNPINTGTVTVDFGDGRKLTGCLIMSNSTSSAGGEQTVLVPYAGGYASLAGVPGSAISE